MSIKRLAWLSDTHLGYRQYGLTRRQADFTRALLHALTDIHAQGIPVVLHTGDLLHSNRPGADTMTDVKKLHAWLEEHNMVMAVIAGNHDRSLDQHHWIHVVNPENKRSGLFLLERECLFVHDLQIYGVGHMAREHFLTHAWPEHTDIIMCHQAVVEFIKFESSTALHIAELPVQKARAVLLGDIHITDLRYEGDTLVGYPGATESNSASEPDAKFWVELLVPARGRIEHKLHPISVRPVVRAEVHSIEDVGKVAATARGFATPPVVHVEYDPSVPDIQAALIRELNPDTYILRADPMLVQPVAAGGTTSGKPVEQAEDINPDLILRDMVGNDPLLYPVASGLVQADSNPAAVLQAFVDQRLREIQQAA